MEMRDILEKQIVLDALDGDTTVLADLLERLPDDVIYNALSDENQDTVNNMGDTKELLDCLEVIRDDFDLSKQYLQKFGDLRAKSYYDQTVTLIKHRLLKTSAIKLIKKLGKKDGE